MMHYDGVRNPSVPAAGAHDKPVRRPPFSSLVLFLTDFFSHLNLLFEFLWTMLLKVYTDCVLVYFSSYIDFLRFSSLFFCSFCQ